MHRLTLHSTKHRLSSIVKDCFFKLHYKWCNIHSARLSWQHGVSIHKQGCLATALVTEHKEHEFGRKKRKVCTVKWRQDNKCTPLHSLCATLISMAAWVRERETLRGRDRKRRDREREIDKRGRWDINERRSVFFRTTTERSRVNLTGSCRKD